MKEPTSTEMRVIMEYLGACYRRAKRKTDIRRRCGSVREDDPVYRSDMNLIYMVERTLADCQASTRNIIQHDYLQVSDPEWYKVFYSDSVYFRNRKLAIKEYIEKLEM